jgi:hypothetical protein
MKPLTFSKWNQKPNLLKTKSELNIVCFAVEGQLNLSFASSFYK